MKQQQPEIPPTSLVRQFRRTLILVISLLLLTLVVRFLTERMVLSSQQQESHQVVLSQIEVSTLLSAMLDQETGLRGYIVTPDAQFLAPFRQGRAHYLAALAQLKQGVQALHFPLSQAALAHVEEQATIWYATFALPLLGDIQAGDLSTPREASEATRGKFLFDRFRQAIVSLQETLSSDLQTLQGRETTLAQSAFLAMAFLSLLIILLLLYTFRRFAGDLRGQLDALQQAALHLAGGELHTRVRVLKHGELRLVGQTLNQMAQALQQQHEELLNRALLIERASEYWALLNTVNTALLFLSPQQQVLVVNDCFTHFFGLSASQIVGQPFDAFAARFEPLFADPSALRVSLTSEATYEQEVGKTILVQVAPERRELELQILPVYALGQHMLGYLYLLRDVTGERELDRLKSEFISTVSHEFRTALTGIQGFSELICEEASDVQEAREFASDIKADAMRLSSMIANLLDLERMQAGKSPLQMEQTDLNALLAEVAHQVQES